MVTEEKGIKGDGLMVTMSNNPSTATMETENDATSTAAEETQSQWVAFSNPTPFIVKARFNITEIELPPDHSAGDEPDQSAEDGTFLQMLIEEGIPVNYTSAENPSKEPNNVGVILDPLDPIAEETLNLVPQSLDLQNADSEEPTNNVDNIVEVIGCSKPISTPLFLHLVPSSASLQDGVITPGTPDLKEGRRGSIDPAIIKLPCEVKALPVKKKVRFDLPGRKASLIGEYEILTKPVTPYGKEDLNKHIYTKLRRNFTSGEESSDNEDEGRPMRRKKRRSKRHAPVSNEINESSGREFEKGKIGIKRNGIDNNEENNEDSGNSSQEYYEESINSRKYEMEGLCGLSSWNPKWLQIFARNEYFLVVFCLVTLAQGMFWNYNKVILSTFQKRFQVTDTQVGYISSGNNIAQMTISVFVAFYGTYWNRLKWLGSAALCSAFAAILAASPHLFYGSGEFAAQVVKNSNETLIPSWWKPKATLKIELCNTWNLFAENCPTDASPSDAGTYILPTALLFSSQLLMGFANSVFWTIGVAHLDDNISKKKTSLHIAFFTIAMVIGPRLGVSLGARCLSFWIDPMSPVPISPHHRNWIGAWWTGFLILCVLIGCPGFLYFCFPKQMRLKSTRHYHFGSPLTIIRGGKEALYAEQAASFDAVSDQPSRRQAPRFTELLRGLKRLFTNKVWVANLFSSVLFALAMSNYFRYKNMFILFHFRKSASSFSFYSGTTSTIATVFGICISAVVMRWYRPRTGYVTAYNVFLSIYGIVSLFVLMTIHCSSNEVAGHLPGQEKWACSHDCNCSETFMPICADDGVTTFYSPCFAGCSQMDLRVTPPLFVNCTCFGEQKWKDYLDEEEPSTIPIIEGRAVAGYCPSKCNALTTYLIIQLLNKLVFASGRIGGTLINIRAVADSDKTLALGCFTMFITLAGFIPTSLILGKAVDSACLAWEMHCGQKGSCSFYDVNKFRLLLHAIPAAFLMMSCICDLIVHMNNFSFNLYGEPLTQNDHLQHKEARDPKYIKSNRKRT